MYRQVSNVAERGRYWRRDNRRPRRTACPGLYPHTHDGVGCPVCCTEHPFITRLRAIIESLFAWR